MRVQVKWQPLRLAARTAGSEYGENTVRVADLLESLSSGVSEDSRPAVVWMYHPAQDQMNQSCEANLFQNEQIGIALRNFRCYRVNVAEIASEQIREEYKDTPAFLFFDPAGQPLLTLAGRKVDSLSSFDSAVEKAWQTSFQTRLKTFQRDMTRLLDRLDKVSAKKVLLEQNVARNAEKRNTRKAAELAKEEAEIEKLAAEIERDEAELLASVQLRDDYLPEKKGEVAEK